MHITPEYSFWRNSEFKFSEFAMRFCVVGPQVPTFVKFLFVSKLLRRIWRVCAPTFPEITTWFESPLSIVFPNVYVVAQVQTVASSRTGLTKFILSGFCWQSWERPPSFEFFGVCRLSFLELSAFVRLETALAIVSQREETQFNSNYRGKKTYHWSPARTKVERSIW